MDALMKPKDKAEERESGEDVEEKKKDAEKKDDDDDVVAKKKKRVMRKKRPKLTIEDLLGPKGVERVYKEFPKRIKLSMKKGQEVRDLDKIFDAYDSWAKYVVPGFDIPTFMDHIARFSGSRMIKDKVKKMQRGEFSDGTTAAHDDTIFDTSWVVSHADSRPTNETTFRADPHLQMAASLFEESETADAGNGAEIPATRTEQSTTSTLRPDLDNLFDDDLDIPAVVLP